MNGNDFSFPYTSLLSISIIILKTNYSTHAVVACLLLGTKDTLNLFLKCKLLTWDHCMMKPKCQREGKN